MSKFAQKLDDRLTLDPLVSEMDELLTLSRQRGSFTSLEDLKSSLNEGTILDVGVLASKALSIPCGNYMVWMTDAGHTMLVPTGQRPTKEVYEHQSDQYDIFTNTLLQNWNKLSRTLVEDDNQKMARDDKAEDEPDQQEEQDETDQIRSTIDASTVDRKPMLRALEDQGYTVTSLANAVGVDPPAISRILRKPKDVQGDPGGRNPSMGLASKVCSILRIDPTAAFPDIFGDKGRYQPRKPPANRGSGMKGAAGGSKRKGSDDYRKGSD